MEPISVDLKPSLCISDIILDKYTLSTLPTEYIDVKLQEDTYAEYLENAQLRCGDIVLPLARTPIIQGRVIDSRILYGGTHESKKIIELAIEFPECFNHAYSAGDTIGVLVSNTKADVETVLDSLKLHDGADKLCEVCVKSDVTKKSAKIPPYIPLKTSPRSIIRDCLELRSIPKKLFLRSLLEYTTAPNEIAFLASVSSKEGSALYTKLILEESRTFLDILKLCPSCCPTLSLLIQHLPRLRPRPYSIASSPLTEEKRIKFIFSLLPDKPGVATSYLENITERFIENPTFSTTINFYFRESNKFIYTEVDAKLNNILIGVGCAVSPFLGFLESKDFFQKRKQASLGSTWLFVGSKYQANSIYRDQLLNYQQAGVLQKFFQSFSQDLNEVKFKHVQDQIKENAEEIIAQFTAKDSILYVCADGDQISKSIENCIKLCMVDVLKCSIDQADIFIKESRRNGKYREDLWV